MSSKLFARTRENVEKLPEAERERAESLLNNLSFQHQQLKKLQAKIRRDGWAENYQNGQNQSGRKKTAEGDAYNSLIKSYTVTVKLLNDMLKEVASPDDDLETKYFK